MSCFPDQPTNFPVTFLWFRMMVESKKVLLNLSPVIPDFYFSIRTKKINCIFIFVIFYFNSNICDFVVRGRMEFYLIIIIILIEIMRFKLFTFFDEMKNEITVKLYRNHEWSLFQVGEIKKINCIRGLAFFSNFVLSPNIHTYY